MPGIRIMLFGLGPVLRYEAITTARRGRYYLARVVYGLVLLFLIGIQFGTWELDHRRGGTPDEIRQFAESAFIQFAGTQGLALLLLIPALVAGVITDEHRRKTLHYLLASRLSSAEIVLGKLGARLVHVAAFVALGLPMVSLLNLFGGINPEYLFYVYFGTAAMVLFVAGFSILISTLARRPRDAILAAYGVEAAWLLGPIALSPIAHASDGPLFWIGPVNQYVMLSNPLAVWSDLRHVSMMGWGPTAWSPWLFTGQLGPIFYWMAGIQGGCGIFFLILAVVGLRPLRGSSWSCGKPQTGWGTRLAGLVRSVTRSSMMSPLFQNQILASTSRRPPCGDNPMIWKERYTTMGGGLKWLGSLPVAILFSLALGCYLFDVAQPVVAGVLSGGRHDGPRLAMNAATRRSSVLLGVLAMLVVASSAAVSLTGEREQDTWVSLATTPLTPGEIVRAKQFGALWSARRIGLALLILWTIGLLLRAIDFLGLVAAFALTSSGAWFLTAVGVFISSRAKDTTRALVATIIVAFIGGWIWPSLLFASLVSDHDLGQMRFGPGQGWKHDWQDMVSSPIGFAIVAAAYAGAAGILTLLSIRRLRAKWCQT